MEVVENQTAASVEDAFPKGESTAANKLKLAGGEKQTNSVDVADTENKVEKAPAVAVPEKDDLLEQIEKAVNDGPAAPSAVVVVADSSDEEISKSSADAFIKKIEEIESDDKKKEVAVVKDDNEKDEVLVNNVVLNYDESSKKDVKVDEEKSEVKSVDATEVSVAATEVVEPKAEADKSEAAVVPVTPKAEVVETPMVVETPKVVEDEIEKELAQFEAPSMVVEESREQEEGMVVDTIEETTNGQVDTDAMEVDSGDKKSDVMEVESSNSPNEVEMGSTPENDVEMKPEKLDEIEKVEEKSSAEAEPTVVIVSDDSDEAESVVKVPAVSSATVPKETPEDECKVDSTHEKPSEKPEKTPSSTATTLAVVNKALSAVKNVESTPSSVSNSPVSTPNVVFNSTPIQKQFEISSENVSKISEAAEASPRHADEKSEDHSGKSESKLSEDSTSDNRTSTTSETDQQSSDGIKKYVDVVKKFNGLADTTTDEEDGNSPFIKKGQNAAFEIKIGGDALKRDSVYEVNISCTENDVHFLSIERLDAVKATAEKSTTGESSLQTTASSSNGSVSSLPAFSLPANSSSEVSSATSTSTASQTTPSRLPVQTTNKHTIRGIDDLCNFMINQFTKIRKNLHPEEEQKLIADEQHTTPKQIRKNTKASPAITETPSSTSKGKRSRKRSFHEDDSDAGTPKTKQAKREIKETPKKDTTADISGPSVLAKWVDKKYYAGKVTAEKPGNKFVVLFEDGASKTLPKDSIVFGEDDILPLQDQAIHALINNDDYEEGIVQSIEKATTGPNDGKVVYTVKCESTTVKVTASQIYLEDDQAKAIQKLQNTKTEPIEGDNSRASRNKRIAASPGTPEAGFSGGVSSKRATKKKRYS